MTTRLEIEEEILRILSQLDAETAMVPIPFNGTLTGAGGATVVAPQLVRGTTQANRFDGRILKVAQDATAVDFSTPVTLTGAHTAATTTLTVSATGLIRAGDVLELGTTLEKVLVQAVPSGTTLTVQRGYQGTTAAALAGGNTIKYDPFGSYTAVDDSGFGTAGELTISPNLPPGDSAMSALYGCGEWFMYPKGLAPEYLLQRANEVLRNTDAPHLWFPSLVTDSDMSSADLTNWDAVTVGASPSTREFVTNAASILYGERSLHLVTADLLAGAETEDFDVSVNEQMIVHVSVRIVTGSLSVILRRVTATAADIKSVTTLGERVFTDVFFRETMPDGIKQASLQFLSATAVSEWYVSPHVIVQSDRRRSYAVPSWWTRENQLKGAIYLYPHYSSNVADSYVSLSEHQLAALNVEFQRSDRDANPMRVSFENHGSYPVGFYVQRPFAELTYDTASTNADKDYVAFKTISNIFRDRTRKKGDDNDQNSKLWADRARNRASMLGYGGRSVQIEERTVYLAS